MIGTFACVPESKIENTKCWDELTDSEKIERLRYIIKSKDDSITCLWKAIDDLKKSYYEFCDAFRNDNRQLGDMIQKLHTHTHKKDGSVNIDNKSYF